MNKEKITGKKIIEYSILLVIIVAGISIRFLFYKSIGKTIETSDTSTYINCAKGLYHHIGLNEYRPPIYPLGLMIAGISFGWYNLGQYIIYLHMLFSIINLIIIYKLTFEIMENRIPAFIVSFLVFISFTIYSWDFIIMSENFAMTEISLILYFLTLFIKRKNIRYFYYLIISLIFALYTKPFFLLLPFSVLIIIILRYIIVKDFKLNEIAKPVLVMFAVFYGSLILYSSLHYVQNGFFGLSSVGNVNFLGKILQYNMEDYGPSNLTKDIKHAEKTFENKYMVNGTFPEPWHFVNVYNWKRNHYKTAGNFAKSIILHHPIEYLWKSVKLTSHITLQSPFKDMIAHNKLSESGEIYFPVLQIKNFTDNINRFYLFIVAGLIESLFLLLFANKTVKKRDFCLLMIMTVILYHYMIASFFSYGDYCRLLVPCYPLIYIIIMYYSYKIVKMIKRVINYFRVCQ